MRVRSTKFNFSFSLSFPYFFLNPTDLDILCFPLFRTNFFFTMNIYVGNIPYKSSEDDLGNLFAEFGDVTSVKIIQDKFTGRSKGFGFVEMNDESGTAAIDALDGFEHMGRNLRVSKANPREESA